MTAHNPFRIAERIAKVIGYIILSSLALFMLFMLGFILARMFDLGWWWLLVVPGFALAFAALAFLIASLRALAEWVGDRWRAAKYRWDDED